MPPLPTPLLVECDETGNEPIVPRRLSETPVRSARKRMRPQGETKRSAKRWAAKVGGGSIVIAVSSSACAKIRPLEALRAEFAMGQRVAGSCDSQYFEPLRHVCEMSPDDLNSLQADLVRKGEQRAAAQLQRMCLSGAVGAATMRRADGDVRRLARLVRGRHHTLERAVVRGLARLASAIRLMHKHEYIHFDVKPGNVLYTATGGIELRLADFELTIGPNQRSDRLRHSYVYYPRCLAYDRASWDDAARAADRNFPEYLMARELPSLAFCTLGDDRVRKLGACCDWFGFCTVLHCFRELFDAERLREFMSFCANAEYFREDAVDDMLRPLSLLESKSEELWPQPNFIGHEIALL